MLNSRTLRFVDTLCLALLLLVSRSVRLASLARWTNQRLARSDSRTLATLARVTGGWFRPDRKPCGTGPVHACIRVERPLPDRESRAGHRRC